MHLQHILCLPLLELCLISLTDFVHYVYFIYFIELFYSFIYSFLLHVIFISV